jgi:phage-related minor tail protein
MAGRELTVRFLGDTSELGKSADGLSSKIGGMAKGLAPVAAGVGAAMGGALALGLANTIDTEAAQAKLSAQLGHGSQLAKDAGEVAGNLYAKSYGASLGEVNEAVRAVLQSGAVMEDVTNEQLQSITGTAMSLAQTFDQDVGGTMRAVAQMIRTGLAPDAETAMDIIARGFQQGNDKAGDLLDTMNEYGVQFQKLGLDGTQAMGLISQGLAAGARDADIVADAVKEFSIRAVDGSKAAADAYKALGLDAQAMTAQIARGGPEASAGLQTVLDRLRAMKDPVAQSAAAVGLFGTQAEDLGAALYALDPSQAVGRMGDVAGAAAKMDQALGETAQAKITGMQRAFEGWTMSLIATDGPLGDVAAGLSVFGEPALAIASNMGIIALSMRGMGIASFFTAGGFAAAWAALTGPIGLTIAAILAIAAVIWYNWDTIKKWTGAAWDWVGDKISAVVGWISDTWNSMVARVTWLKDMVVFHIHAMVARVSGLWDSFVARVTWLKDTVIFKFHELVNWIRGIPDWIRNALGNIYNTLTRSGEELVDGFLAGIKRRWDSLVAWVRQGMAGLRNLWPFSPAKEGPFSGRGYVTYSGRALTNDFADSIRRGMPQVESAVRGVMGAASGNWSPSITPVSSLRPAAAGGGVARVTIDSAGSRLDDVLLEVLRNALRSAGIDATALGG